LTTSNDPGAMYIERYPNIELSKLTKCQLSSGKNLLTFTLPEIASEVLVLEMIWGILGHVALNRLSVTSHCVNIDIRCIEVVIKVRPNN
jgi:hypothetical protein